MANSAVHDGGASCGSAATATPACFVAENWNEGYVGVTFQRITSALGVPVIAMTKANFSAEVYVQYKGGSSFTRCCHEITLGNVDICASNFWETEERRGLTSFTSALVNDAFKIVSLAADPEAMNSGFSFAALFTPILAPFEGLLWGVMCANFVLAGVMLWFFEAGTENPDYGDPWEGVMSPLGAAKGVYLSYMGFVCGSAVNNATVWPGRLVLLGLAYTTFMFVAAYQANLAAFMVGKLAPGALIDKFTDIGQLPGGKVCLLEAISSSVMLSYGWNKDKIKGVDEFGAMLETLLSGKHGCVAALMGKFEYMAFIEAQSAKFTYCSDPADANQYSKCTLPVTTAATTFDLNCKCSDLTKNSVKKECLLECPYVHRYCGVLTVNDLDFSLSVPVGIGTDIQRDGCVNQTKPADVINSDTGPVVLTIKDMLSTYIVAGVVMMIGVILRAFQYLLSKLPSRGANSEADVEGEEKSKTVASGGLVFVDSTHAAAEEETDPMRKEIQSLNTCLCTMLDKLKEIESKGRG
eukprot:CAMPEP_0173098332 /NCGR_PEP_ID=MMETSP1102-20130122/34650_1 /TAXON_ID=49646 /ORGANISM="Geminigera sp., Strain Caron Lab Isolate" /LENGTH=523 /DNA_ID=CAMNT_0013990773 /DNA_START=288 /DNA_END=1860 /DNA_ORIENTATION=+